MGCVSCEEKWLMWLFLHSALRSPQRVITTLKPRGRGNDAAQLVPSRGRLHPLLRRHIWVTTIFLQSVPAWGIIPDPSDDDGRKGWRQASRVLTSLTCLQGDESEPLFLQQIRSARKVIRALERQTQGLWFLPWESHIFTHWWAPIRAAQQLCTK